MYVLDLFKKDSYSPVSDPKGYLGSHVILGYYDLLKISSVERLEDTFTGVASSGEMFDIYQHYMKHSMALFELPPCLTNDGKNPETDLIAEMMADSTPSALYLFVSCKINHTLIYAADCEHELPGNTECWINGVAMLEAVKRHVVDKLAKCAEKKGVRFQVLGNLGSFDFSIIISHNCANELVKLPFVIRTTLCPNNNFQLFSYSSSFIAFSLNTIDVEQLSEEPLDVSVNISTYQNLNKTILGNVNDQIGDRKCGIVIGDYDISIDMRQITLKEIIEGYFINFTTETMGMLHPFSGEFSCQFRAITTMIKNSKGFSDCDDCCGVFSEKPGKLKKYLIDKESTRKRSMEEFVITIWNLYQEVRIPDSVRHTLNNCVNTCIALLRNDLKYYAGLRMALALKAALININNAYKAIKAVSVTHPHDAICKTSFFETTIECIRDISMILPSTIQVDSYLLDSMENVDSISPVSKLLLSYENIILQAFNRADKHQNNDEQPTFFITVGCSGTFNSVEYDWSYFIKKVIKSPRLVSFNMPNSTSLSLEDMPYILHEVGHHINVSNTSRLARNQCLHELFLSYSALMIINSYDAMYSNKRKLPDGGFLEYEKERLNNLMRDAGVEPNGSMSMSAFKEAWRMGLKNVTFAASEIGHLAYSTEILISGGRFLDVLKGAFSEAEADVTMILLGDYTLEDYLEAIRVFFIKNDIDPSNDESYKLRLTMVIGYFYKTQGGEASFEHWLKKVKQCDRSTISFIDSFMPFICTQIGLAKPVMEYLANEMSAKISPMLFNDLTGKQILRGEMDLKQEIEMHVNNWYNHLYFLEKGRYENDMA